MLDPISSLQCLTLPICFGGVNQSSGKSSVLESVVGRDFLPRGSGSYFSPYAIFVLYLRRIYTH